MFSRRTIRASSRSNDSGPKSGEVWVATVSGAAVAAHEMQRAVAGRPLHHDATFSDWRWMAAEC